MKYECSPHAIKLHAEKSLQDVDVERMIETFKVNTVGHLLVYKHFMSLLPHKSHLRQGEADPTGGVIPTERSALVSLSARVGSIEDNERGGYVAQFTLDCGESDIRFLFEMVLLQIVRRPAFVQRCEYLTDSS